MPINIAMSERVVESMRELTRCLARGALLEVRADRKPKKKKR